MRGGGARRLAGGLDHNRPTIMMHGCRSLIDDQVLLFCSLILPFVCVSLSFSPQICDFGVARMMTLDQHRHLVAFPGIRKNKPGKIGYM
jgi:hypothetical protein